MITNASRAACAVTALIYSMGSATAAEPARGEWIAAPHSGSERLLLYTLLKETPPGTLNTARRLTYETGLAPSREVGWERLSTEISAAPILQFDDNINGGVPGDSFYLRGLEFSVDDDARAKEGIVVGASAGVSANFSFGDRHLLELDAIATSRYSPEHKLSKTSISGSACASFFQGDWTWLETCAGALASKSDLSRTKEQSISMAGARIFSSPIGSHEGRAAISYRFREDYEKPVLELDLATAHAAIGSLSLGIDLSPKVAGENTTVLDVSARVARSFFGSPGSIFGSYAYQSGSAFFGTSRKDDVYSMWGSRRVRGGISATVGVVVRRSTVDLFDGTSVFFGLNFDGWHL